MSVSHRREDKTKKTRSAEKRIVCEGICVEIVSRYCRLQRRQLPNRKLLKFLSFRVIIDLRAPHLAAFFVECAHERGSINSSMRVRAINRKRNETKRRISWKITQTYFTLPSFKSSSTLSKANESVFAIACYVSVTLNEIISEETAFCASVRFHLSFAHLHYTPAHQTTVHSSTRENIKKNLNCTLKWCIRMSSCQNRREWKWKRNFCSFLRFYYTAALCAAFIH
jgi:hypothetical protein